MDSRVKVMYWTAVSGVSSRLEKADHDTAGSLDLI